MHINSNETKKTNQNKQHNGLQWSVVSSEHIITLLIAYFQPIIIRFKQ